MHYCLLFYLISLTGNVIFLFKRKNKIRVLILSEQTQAWKISSIAFLTAITPMLNTIFLVLWINFYIIKNRNYKKRKRVM